MIKQFIAMKAFIERDGKVLVVRESPNNPDGTKAGKYDLVGGRVAAGERYDDALIREIKEEVGLAAYIGRPVAVDEWHPVVRGEHWQIICVFFTATPGNEEVKLSRDHDHYKWMDPELYETEDIMENLHKVFDAYLEQRQHD